MSVILSPPSFGEHRSIGDVSFPSLDVRLPWFFSLSALNNSGISPFLPIWRWKEDLFFSYGLVFPLPLWAFGLYWSKDFFFDRPMSDKSGEDDVDDANFSPFLDRIRLFSFEDPMNCCKKDSLFSIQRSFLSFIDPFC